MRFGLAKFDWNIPALIKYFYNQYLTEETRLILKLMLVAFFMGSFYILTNAFSTNYPGFNYLPWRWVFLAPFVFGITAYAMTVEDKAPRLAFFTKTYGIYFFIAITFAILTNGIQYTPFPTIDKSLLHFDQFVRFSTPALLQWTAEHPVIKKVFEFAYEFLNVEILLIPLILPWLYDKKRVYQFFSMMLIAFLIGTTVYYFFPTAAPVSVIHSSYFIPDVHATYTKFYEVHHYQAVTTGEGGMIAFPSFHVIWAVLLTYSLRGRRILFYPFALINLVVILSTLFLGWHYLTDVMAGMMLSVITIRACRH